MEDNIEAAMEMSQPASRRNVITGVLERITYQDERTGYMVARLLPDPPRVYVAADQQEHQRREKVPTDNDQLVTIVGTLFNVEAGEGVELTGFWQRHPKHGWRFCVLSYRTVLPATIQGLRKYLGSGMIRGIGPRTAEKIVAKFGLDVFKIIEQEPKQLLEVPGLGARRAARIVAAWEEHRAIHEVMVCLQGLGVSTSLAVRIYKEYGDAAITVVKQEPFRLAREVWGIGFKTADKIATALGYTKDHPERIKAGVLFALAEASDDGGHIYLPRLHLTQKAADLLGVRTDLVEEALDGLFLEKGVHIETLVVQPTGQMVFQPLSASANLRLVQGRSREVRGLSLVQPAQSRLITPTPTVDSHTPSLPDEPSGEQVVYLPPFAAAEQGIARNLLRLAQCPPEQGRLRELQQIHHLTMFEYLETKECLTLAERQQAGIVMALTYPVSILTGGPGTGKTTSLRALIRVLTLKQKRVLLATPTGRAAKRLAEATGITAQTLHRLLQLRPGNASRYDHTHPLPADVVIVDEVSMLDTLLANTLLKAIGTGTHLLLVGDADQLPSVGAGNVLADLLASDVMPVVRLEQIFRQSVGSQIALNAQRINAGLMPVTSQENTEFFFFSKGDPDATSDEVLDLVVKRIPARFGISPREIQVLAPMHRGACGVGSLNMRLQALLNPRSPDKAERAYGGTYFRVGDKVLQLRNNYEKEVFNGDGGYIISLSVEEQTLKVRLDDEREVTYDFSELDELTLAYAVSVHKAQGSEYRACVIPVAMEQYLLLERRLIYTAVTRARQLVVLVGSKKALAIAVNNGPPRQMEKDKSPAEAQASPTYLSSRSGNRKGRYTGLAIRLRQLAEAKGMVGEVEEGLWQRI